MRMQEKCLPCMVNQAIRVAEMTGAENREALYRKVFLHLAGLDYTRTTPEAIGGTFRIIKEHLGNPDPYRAVRRAANECFLALLPAFEARLEAAPDPFHAALLFAAMANVVDYNPMHDISLEDMLSRFDGVERRSFAIDDSADLRARLACAQTILFIGDNCGEICVDRLLVERIRRMNPQADIAFAVRGAPVVNDSIAEDASFVGMDRFARVVSNGDDSLGTVLDRVSPDFRTLFDAADIVIAKGQANYESLSASGKEGCFFLMLAKCAVIAGDAGVPVGEMVCMRAKTGR